MIKTLKKTGKPNLDDALLAFRRVMTEALRVEAARVGQSLSHLEALRCIAEKGSPSLKDVAIQLRISPPSASVLVEALVKKKLVTRTVLPSDRRATRLALTPQAHKLFAALHRRKISIFRKMLSRLSGADQKKLAEILITCIPK